MHLFSHLRSIPVRRIAIQTAVLFAASALGCAAQTKPEANPTPDVLVLSNGDTLHGKFVNSLQGKITFHSDPLGDVTVTWDKVKELHTAGQFSVLEKDIKLHGRKSSGNIPTGTLEMSNQAVIVQPASGEAIPPIPVKDAVNILDTPTLHKQLDHEPSLFSGWNGAATAGGTVITATQNQYTVSGGISLARTVPTAPWLNAFVIRLTSASKSCSQ
jgi:hypothetical protein